MEEEQTLDDKCDEKEDAILKERSDTPPHTTKDDIDTYNDNASQYFTKHLDVESGKFYHIIRATNEIIWDKPKGSSLPLEINEEPPLSAPSQKQCSRFERQKLRQFIIQENTKNHEKERIRQETKSKLNKEEDEKCCWRKECEKGIKDNGKVQVDWKEFGYISEEIYNFQTNNPHVKLLELSLNGNNLDSIYDLSIHCSNLCRLSLACNRIRHLDESIGKLASLTHLNLLRNELETLPHSIGSLTHLQVLDVSHNSLSFVPETIGKLKQMKVFNFECNQLTELPNVFAKMRCEVINLNSNNLTSLPSSIGHMRYLKRLSVCDNKFMFLPIHMCSLRTLKVLHMSKNFIKELPNAIGQLSSLECLWLDNNKLSALPFNFYQLKNLKELQMECNLEMVNPSMEILVKGPQEVLKWCELKLAKKNYMRKRNIIMAMQDILEQVHRLKLDGGNNLPHEAVFEANVMYKGELHYQFLMHIFWSSFLPKLEKIWSEANEDQLKGIVSSFPYERMEVEQTLFQFSDAAGNLIHHQKRAKFKRCCCSKEGNDKKQCFLKNDTDWKCERPAVLLRKVIILETMMTERRRKEVEERRVNEAIEAAIKTTKQHLESLEGQDEVRSIAEDRIAVRKNSSESSNEVKRQNIDSSSNKHKNAITLLMECLPQKRKEEKEIEEEMCKIKEEILQKEINARKSKAIEINKKLRKVLKAWLGLTTEDVFVGWRKIVIEKKIQRSKDEMVKSLEKQRLDSEEKEKQLMAINELKLWQRRWDNFQDLPFWQHSLTNEVMWDEPTLEFILKCSKWSFPTKNTEVTIDMDKISKKARNSREKEHLEAAMNILKRRKEALKKKK